MARKLSSSDSRCADSYVRQLDATHSVRIIMQSVAEEANNIRRGYWRQGWGSCYGGCMVSCCLPWVCPCISIAQISGRIGLWPYYSTVTLFFVLHVARLGFPVLAAVQLGEEDPSSAVVACAIGLMAFAIAAFVIGVARLRTSVRERFAIPGTFRIDVLAACFCSCCVIGQMASHVKCSKVCSAPDTLPAYDSSV